MVILTEVAAEFKTIMTVASSRSAFRLPTRLSRSHTHSRRFIPRKTTTALYVALALSGQAASVHAVEAAGDTPATLAGTQSILLTKGNTPFVVQTQPTGLDGDNGKAAGADAPYAAATDGKTAYVFTTQDGSLRDSNVVQINTPSSLVGGKAGAPVIQVGENGANGADAIHGSNLRIIIDGGSIKGGAGSNGVNGRGANTVDTEGNALPASKGGNGGNGGAAIVGSDLDIVFTDAKPAGSISAGTPGFGRQGIGKAGGDAQESGGHGRYGEALHFTGGNSLLTLEMGSIINGSVLLDAPAGSSGSMLHILNNAAEWIDLNGRYFTGYASINQGPILRKPLASSFPADFSTEVQGRMRMPQLTVGEGATLMVSGKGQTRIGDLVLKDGSTFSVIARSVLNGDGTKSSNPESFRLVLNNSKATISKTGTTFNLAGITDGSAADQFLFVTENQLNSEVFVEGDFAKTAVGGIAVTDKSPVDYLTFASGIAMGGERTQAEVDADKFGLNLPVIAAHPIGYQATYKLSWLEDPAKAHGTFTIAEGGDFTLGAVLADVSANTNTTTPWDGKSLTKAGPGVLQLTAANLYTGPTTINAGVLKAGVADAFAKSSALTIAADATLNLGGFSQAVSAGGAITNNGTILFNSMNAGKAGSNAVSLTGNLTNAGTLDLDNGDNAVGKTLKIIGDWVGGTNSLIKLAAVLGNGDDSVTDKVEITGAATGSTQVQVRNINGAGTTGTTSGITLITAGDGSTNGAFTLNTDTITANGLVYSLLNKADSANHKLWYLSSAKNDGGDVAESVPPVVDKPDVPPVVDHPDIPPVVEQPDIDNVPRPTIASGTTLPFDFSRELTADEKAKYAVNAEGDMIFAEGVALDIAMAGISEAEKSGVGIARVTGAIKGDLPKVTLNGAAQPDYLTASVSKSEDGKTLQAGYKLNWNETADKAHGTFTVASGSFGLGAALADVSANTNTATPWDGKTLTKDGPGTLVLNATNSYSGDTIVNQGELKAGAENTFATSANLTVAKGATLNMGGYAQSVGGDHAGAITNRGRIVFNDTGKGKNGAGPMSLTGNVSNAGTLELDTGDGTVGKTFQVQGDWFGDVGSLISLTAALAGDDSNTDKVDITGAATGTTRVKVRNVGGAGGETTADGGITLITTGSSVANAFVLDSPVTAGGYVYKLRQGRKDATGKINEGIWVLSSLADTLVSTIPSTKPLTITAGKPLGADTLKDYINEDGNLNIAADDPIQLTDANPPATSEALDTPKAILTLPATGPAGNDTNGIHLNGTPKVTVFDTGATEIDYLTPSLKVATGDAKKLELSYKLRWNEADKKKSGGNFTIAENGTFKLATALADVTGVDVATNDFKWDGKALTKKGAGTLELAAVSTYTGATTVEAGTLKTAVANAIANTSNVIIRPGATLNLGATNQNFAGIENQGTIVFNDVKPNGTPVSTPVVLKLGTGGGRGKFLNGGTLNLKNCDTCATQTFTIDGDWEGKDASALTLGAVLGDDSSPADKLIIQGVASGKTLVTVENEGGKGGQTVEGITLITAVGGSAGTDTFALANDVTAGGYVYSLHSKENADKKANGIWYLTSAKQAAPDSDDIRNHNVSPLFGAYASNLLAANTLFNTSLSDRESGESVDPVTGARGRVWARVAGGTTHGMMFDGENRFSADRSLLQLGSSIIAGSMNGQDAWRVGVMAGHGQQRSKTRNAATGNARGQVDGYSVGVYGTWYQDGQSHGGAYVDGWLLYNDFDNSAQGSGLKEKYKADGMTASIEAGYAIDVTSFTSHGGREHRFSVRPQAQVLYGGVKAKTFVQQDAGPTTVKGEGDGNIQTRLGARLAMVSKPAAAGASLAGQVETALELNWLHNTNKYGVAMGANRNWILGADNVGEVKVAVSGNLSDNLALSANVTHQQGDHRYRDTQGGLSLKYQF
ncbi:autotransporter outer membrane beta-barrel domain-containing protein [Achromobacter xylosoxidans]|uniref:autotransporter outer membrane beta-barrel domain-containing protein n=1 Tax=Alcaligenes xylosoxydans xylosoxydans TaxID=85698 RepID=UPI0015C78F27|nr:autotransporter outer membrane beta-barrel domain-containing protein [Achromobacter xylosoxidans]NYS11795.1 autotransporter outer membrane beta-barrel domain-containing protein [Achromobacter xylosoxidans]